jgi:hypothetical protein
MDRNKYTLTLALLDMWRCPWSSKYIRFTAYATMRANAKLKVDVLEVIPCID